MSTQPEAEDLDRTDELPQLDVVAYEAELGLAPEERLSSTDTWLVESLRDNESAEVDALRDPQTRPLMAGSADLSISIDPLRQRIAGLENELEHARATLTEERARLQTLAADRAEIESRTTSLTADNARLQEQLGIAHELTQRQQGQLLAQAENHKAQLDEIAGTRESERAAAEQQRVALEQQLERSAANFTSTADEQAKLRRALEEALALAAARARQMDDLQRALTEEQSKTDTLGRNLAAKLATFDVVSSQIAQRDASISVLEQLRDELRSQLHRAAEEKTALEQQLTETQQRAEAADRFAADATERDARLTLATAEIERLKAEQHTLTHTQQSTEKALMDARAQTADADQRQQALQAQVDELRQSLQALTNERDQLTSKLQQQADSQQDMQRTLDLALAQVADGESRERAVQVQLNELEQTLRGLAGERDLLLPLRDQLAARNSEMESLANELATVRRDAVTVWSELESQSSQASQRQQELAAARQTVQDLEQALAEARRNIERLRAVSGDDTRLLNERNAQLAGLRAELDSVLREHEGFESALNARDTLIADLRAEMRTAQDERAIMSDQLTKMRARVKALTQQVFNRDNRIAVLKADLAVHTEALAAIRRDVDRIDPSAPVQSSEAVERTLEPVNHEGDPIALNRRVMTIGRTNDNDIFIPSRMISRHHARLLIGPNAVIVEDAGSTNGCFVNDQQVKQHVLHDGDVLMMGDLKFRLRVGAKAGAEK